MLRLTLITLAVAALCGMAVTGCGVRFDDGPHRSETRSLESFQRIELDGSASVTVRRGAQQVVVEGGEKVVKATTTRVQDGTLIIGGDDDATIDFGGSDVSVEITVPTLVGVSVDGSGDLDLPELDGGSLEVSVDGSGNVRGSGTLDELDATADGSGDIDLGDVTVQRATLDVSGSGDADVHVVSALDVSVSGSGDVHYAGDPSVRKDVSGSGDVERE